MMEQFSYVLCSVTSLVCAFLLARHYLKTRSKLLFWSAICFVGFFIENLLTLVDLSFYPKLDLSLGRYLIAFASVFCLLNAFIWENA